MSTLTLNPTLLSQPRQPVQSTVTPAPNGLSVLLRFPRLGQEGLAVTFQNLDAWLSLHPKCQMIMLADLPLSWLFWRRLNQLRRKHGVAVTIMPPKM